MSHAWGCSYGPLAPPDAAWCRNGDEELNHSRSQGQRKERNEAGESFPLFSTGVSPWVRRSLPRHDLCAMEEKTGQQKCIA